MADVSVEFAAARVADELDRRGVLAAQTQVRVLGILGRFVEFMRSRGVESLANVTPEQVRGFVEAATARRRTRPSIATMRLRRWVLRLFFRVALDLGLGASDPTATVSLPGRTMRSARPLSDDEVAACRRASLHDLTSTRLSTAWSLGEATARTNEIPHVRAADVDLARARIWIGGGARTTSRWGELTTWGAAQVRRRLDEPATDRDAAFLVGCGEAKRESRVSFSAQALRETLERAGLLPGDRVSPASLAGWAARQVFDRSGRIEDAARALGVRSLDAAARAIDWDWTTTTPGDDG